MAGLSPNAILADVSYGLDLLSSLNGALDVVGIYDGATQLFAQARPMKASIREEKRVMQHPLETGAIRSDHSIINPVEITIPVIVSAQYYVTTYQQIKNAFINDTLLTIKTMVNVYNNMIISALPHEEDPEVYSAVLIGLRFTQVLYDTANLPGAIDANYAPVSPQDQNAVNSGLQSGIALVNTALNSARSVLSYTSLLRRN